MPQEVVRIPGPGGNGAAAPVVTFTLVERKSNHGACSSALTVTLSVSTTAGEAMIITYMMGVTSGATATITDSASETYTKAFEKTAIAAHYTTGTAYKLTTASGITTVSITASAGGTGCVLIVEHVKRSIGTWAVDQNSGSPTASASPWSSTPTVTTTAANEWEVGSAFINHSSGGTCAGTSTGAWSAGLNDSNGDGAGNNMFLADQAVSTIQTGVAFTGTSGTCTVLNTYPAMVTFQ
jgi:hypothetical protein